MKKLLSLLLILSLCFAFTACGEEEWEDEELFEKYEDLIDYLEDEDYGKAIEFITGLAAKDNNDGKDDPIAVLPELYGTWYIRSNYATSTGKFQELTFSKDGKCTMDGAAYSWILSSESENAAYLYLYEGDVQRYSASLRLYETGIVMLSMSGVEINYNAEYVKSAVVDDLTSGSWIQLDETDTVSDSSFDIGANNIYISGTEYKYNVLTLKEDTAELELYQPGINTIEYTVTMTYRDALPLVTLTDTAAKTSYLYYHRVNNEYGFLDSWPEVCYWRALDVLEDASDGSSAYCSWLENGKNLTHYEALAYALELLQQCGNYKDSQQLVSRFTVYNGMLTGVDLVTTDNLEQVNTSTDCWKYSYDANGNRCYTYDSWMPLLYLGDIRHLGKASLNYEFDENGVITRITQGSTYNISAIMTPDYDAAGNMTSLTVQTNSGTYTNYFTYDNAGNMIRAEYATDSQPSVAEYYRSFTYDAQGRLIREEGKISRYYYGDPYVCLYTYDDAGKLIKQEFTYDYEESYRTDFTDTYTYSYDSEGRISSVDYKNSDTTSLASQVYQYKYTDLYFFDYPTE